MTGKSLMPFSGTLFFRLCFKLPDYRFYKRQRIPAVFRVCNRAVTRSDEDFLIINFPFPIQLQDKIFNGPFQLLAVHKNCENKTIVIDSCRDCVIREAIRYILP